MKRQSLILCSVLLFAFTMNACVPRSRVKAEYDHGFKDGRLDAIRGCADVVSELRSDLKQKDALLSKFNQLNADGSVRTKKKWTGDTWEDDVTGAESWQK